MGISGKMDTHSFQKALDQFTKSVTQGSVDRSVDRQIRRSKDRLINSEVEQAAEARLRLLQAKEQRTLKPKPRPKRRRKRR